MPCAFSRSRLSVVALWPHFKVVKVYILDAEIEEEREGILKALNVGLDRHKHAMTNGKFWFL